MLSPFAAMAMALYISTENACGLLVKLENISMACTVPSKTCMERVTDFETMEPIEVQDKQFSGANLRKKRAAVLICLFQGIQGELRVILTKRSTKLSPYPGDVALPGGKMEEGDADGAATALREAMEEIGLNPDLVQVVANLDPFISLCQIEVVPVVGLLPKIGDFKPVLNIDEVDAVFDVPLEMFLKDENHRFEEKEWKGWKYIANIFDYNSEQGDFLIWGLTASILIKAASVIYQRSPCFNQLHLPDFQQLQKSFNSSHEHLVAVEEAESGSSLCISSTFQLMYQEK